MNAETLQSHDVEILMRDVWRYLRAVDTFRAEGHEPRWRPEPTGPPPALRRPLALAPRPIA